MNVGALQSPPMSETGHGESAAKCPQWVEALSPLISNQGWKADIGETTQIAAYGARQTSGHGRKISKADDRLRTDLLEHEGPKGDRGSKRPC